MKDCWAHEAEQRPDFTSIRKSLEVLYEAVRYMCTYLFLSLSLSLDIKYLSAWSLSLWVCSSSLQAREGLPSPRDIGQLPPKSQARQQRMPRNRPPADGDEDDPEDDSEGKRRGSSLLDSLEYPREDLRFLRDLGTGDYWQLSLMEMPSCLSGMHADLFLSLPFSSSILLCGLRRGLPLVLFVFVCFSVCRCTNVDSYSWCQAARGCQDGARGPRSERR